MKSVPTRDGQAPLVSPVDDVTSKFVFPIDGRYDTNTYTGQWYASTFAKLPQDCTATLIGPSTALSAAHCFYQQALGWIATGNVSFGARTIGTTVTTPFGSYPFDSVTFPSGWFGDNWDWDFAVLEFSPTRYPGNQVGWMGVEQSAAGAQFILGYPQDKGITTSPPKYSQWGHGDNFYSTLGTLCSPCYKHYLDVFGGESGACVFNAQLRCTGIQSTARQVGSNQWNEARRWDSVTYNFFDTYGNWP